MRLRALARLAGARPTEAKASALVRDNFAALQLSHRAAIARDLDAPLLLLADHHDAFGRAVCAANGIAEPEGPCLFTTTEAAFVASLSASSPAKIAQVKLLLAGLPPASAECMRVVVFAGGDMTILHYVFTASTKAA